MGKRVRVMHRATSESLAKKQKEQMLVAYPPHPNNHFNCVMDGKDKVVWVSRMSIFPNIKILNNVNLLVTLFASGLVGTSKTSYVVFWIDQDALKIPKSIKVWGLLIVYLVFFIGVIYILFKLNVVLAVFSSLILGLVYKNILSAQMVIYHDVDLSLPEYKAEYYFKN